MSLTGDASAGDAAKGRRAETQALSFTLALVLAGSVLVGLGLFAGSMAPAGIAGVLVIGAATLSLPGATATRVMGAAVVLAPDLVTVAHVGGSPVTARTAVFLLLEIATLFALLRQRLILRVPAPALVLLLTSAGVIGAVQNDRTKSVPEFLVLTVFPLVVGATLASDRRVAREFLVGITAATLILCLVGLVETATDHVFFVDPNGVFADTFIRADHVRAAAGWAFPTEFSAFLCLTGFLVIDVFRARWGTLGMIAAGVLVTASVIATQSRSGLIGLVAGALIYLLLQRRLGQGLRVIGALGAALVLLLVLPGAAPETFRTFVAQSLTPGSGANATVTYRQELYHDAAAALADRPLFGYGYGSGRSVSTNALGSYFGDLTDLASLPVSMSVQIGYLGTAAVALLLIWTLFKLARRTDVMARLPLAAGLLGCAVAMSGVPLSSPVTLMLLLVGLGWQLCSKTSSEDPPEAPALETHSAALRSGTAPLAADHKTNSGTA